nr:MAG TPA_asm: hypothetical protein [Caudoviricetes sp.]
MVRIECQLTSLVMFITIPILSLYLIIHIPHT